LEALRSFGDYRILVSPDHPTPLRIKTHSHGYVPWAMSGTGISPGGQMTYDEQSASSSDDVLEEGWRLMGRFVG